MVNITSLEDGTTRQVSNGRARELLATLLAVALDRDGKPAELIGDLEPENCDHAGQTWSDNIDLRCTRCGARLFLPGRLLAHRSEDQLEEMHAAWVRAGWPGWVGAHWPRGERWTIVDYPGFEHIGGLAVRADRLDGFPGGVP